MAAWDLMRRRSLIALGPLVVALGCGGGHQLAAREVADAGSPSGLHASPVAAPSSPAAAPVTPPTARELPAVTLAFGGDVHFEGASRARLDADPATALQPVAGVLSAADLAIVNLETAVTDRGTAAPKQYVFRAPATAFTALKAAGIDVATMANNHGMDYGVVGLRDSLAAARAAGFPVVGIGEDEASAYRPYVADVRGVRVAVIGATQVLDDHLVQAWTAGPGKPGLASAKRVERLLAEVRTARARADVVVVDVHYGTERTSCPTVAQTSIARSLVEAGADVVVGSHAHVLLGGGWMGQAYVDYGLGNFVFYSSGSGASTQTGVLTLTVRGRHVQAAHWTPAHIEGGVPRPLSGPAAVAAQQRWSALRGCTGLSAGPGR